jgi:cold-inducible RNA-binding protein
MKLFIGNLSLETTEDDLRDIFEQVGEVESVLIVTDRDTSRSKGFGFVAMDEEAAWTAIVRYNGTELHGRSLTVNEGHSLAKNEFTSRARRGRTPRS